MKRFCAALIMLWVGVALVSGTSIADAIIIQSENSGPTIDWYVQPNETVVLAWDGIYSGQTEEFWNQSIWINDTDGVDTVIFRYRWFSETEWTNKSPTLIDGNDTVGRYNSNFTYAVWWNYTLGGPQTEGNGGNFDFQVFANDTLGNWSETGILTYSGGYMIVSPPPEVIFFSNLLPTLGAAAVIIVIITIVIVIRRR